MSMWHTNITRSRTHRLWHELLWQDKSENSFCFNSLFYLWSYSFYNRTYISLWVLNSYDSMKCKFYCYVMTARKYRLVIVRWISTLYLHTKQHFAMEREISKNTTARVYICQIKRAHIWWQHSFPWTNKQILSPIYSSVILSVMTTGNAS